MKLYKESFDRLKSYCENEGFKGWDPYDGLNSRLFQSIPVIRSSRFFRLAWIQFFKRSPINFRKIAFVPKGYNAKGLGLFLIGYCNLYNNQPTEETLNNIEFLADKLLKMQTPGFSGACWGYNFDWQARAFFQPKGTPTIVATSFIVDGLIEAYHITKKNIYLETVKSSVQFVLKDLNRTYDEDGTFSFSYSPLDKTQVFNASLLGAKLLAKVYELIKDEKLLDEAEKAIKYVCKRQRPNGAWGYGILPYHQWVDNFHTGFNLECINSFQEISGKSDYSTHIEKGLEYYLNNFFTKEGMSKYYDDSLYPVDIHSPSQLVVTLSKLKIAHENKDLIQRVLNWTIENMQDEEGYFYYQIRSKFSSKIPYMRWAQAWIFYAYSFLTISQYK